MSVYRVSTANSFDKAVSNIGERQTKLGELQDQLSSGKRVSKASDDPVAAVLSERTRNRMAQREADLRALDASRRSLEQMDSALGQTADLYHRARELVVQAGNATLTATDRADLAAQLGGIREQLLEISNRRDTAGNTLFGGLGGSNQPFADVYDGAGRAVRFDGQRGQESATAQRLPKMLDGFEVFMGERDGTSVFRTQAYGTNTGTGALAITGVPTSRDVAPLDENAQLQGRYVIEFSSSTPPGPGQTPGPANTYAIYKLEKDNTLTTVVSAGSAYPPGTPPTDDGLTFTFSGIPNHGDKIEVKPADTDVFATLDRMIEALEFGTSPHPGATGQEVRRQEIDMVLQELDFRLNQSLEARGRVGDYLNRADGMETLFTNQRDYYEKENSELTDLDMVKGISEFQSNQVGLDAALKTYSQVQRLSLFQYIA
jgi:flagellar hook-associated protein 3 FlgL